MPIERDGRRSDGLRADAVAAHHWHEVAARVALHAALPMRPGVVSWILRFAANRRGIQEHFSTQQHHCTCRLRKPLRHRTLLVLALQSDPSTKVRHTNLIPTYADAKAPMKRLPNLEAGVSWREVELLLVACAIRYVALTVDAQHCSIRIHHRAAVEVRLARTLQKRHCDNDTQFECERGHPEGAGDGVTRGTMKKGVRKQNSHFDGRTLLHDTSFVEIRGPLLLSYVNMLKEFLENDYLGSLRGRLSNDDGSTLLRTERGKNYIEQLIII